MKRISFNAGELSPELCMRADLDAYHRGVRTLVNWDVSQTGTLKRRRGMQAFADALERSRLVPYVYSNTGKERYLIEAGDDVLRVLEPDSGGELARFDTDWRDADSLRWKQVNNLLLFTHPASPPQVLKREGGQWVFERFRFKSPPWRYTGYREKGGDILLLRNADGSYSVILPDSLPEVERQMEDGDLLRASWFTEQQEAFAYRSALLSGVQRVETLSRASSFATGAKLALRGDVSLAYYVCTKDLEAGDFVNGLHSPENYPDHFLKADNTSGFDGVTPISGLSGKKYTKNEKVVLRSGYWEYFTCVPG